MFGVKNYAVLISFVYNNKINALLDLVHFSIQKISQASVLLFCRSLLF